MRIYPKSREEAERIKEDYEFLGIDVRFDGNALVIGQPQKKQKKKEEKRPSKRREPRD